MAFNGTADIDVHRSKQSLPPMFLCPAEERHGEGSSERGQEPSSLVRFLARAPDHVAVGQPKSSDFGDIRDTEAKHLEPTSRLGKTAS